MSEITTPRGLLDHMSLVRSLKNAGAEDARQLAIRLVADSLYQRGFGPAVEIFEEIMGDQIAAPAKMDDIGRAAAAVEKAYGK